MTRLHHSSITIYGITPTQRVKVVTPEVHCPACGRLCTFRLGVHFDHERSCGDCNICWEPRETYLLVTDEMTTHAARPQGDV